MKIPRFITSGLASGAIRMRPEVLDVMKKIRGGGSAKTSDATSEDKNPKPPKVEESPPSPPCRSQRRMVFVSPLPGRWVRSSCLMLGCAALCI